MWSPKSVNKIFLRSKTQTKNFGLQMENFGDNFSFKNQNEENAFEAAMAIFFSQKDKIKYKHADYLYTYLH